MSVSCMWCVSSRRILCDGLITRPEESYWVRECVSLNVSRCNSNLLHLQWVGKEARLRNKERRRDRRKFIHLFGLTTTIFWNPLRRSPDKFEKDLPKVWRCDRVVPYSGQAEHGIRKKLSPQTRSGAHPTSSSMCTGRSFAGAWSDHAPPSIAEVRKEWIYRLTSTPPYFFMTCTCTSLSLLFLVCLTCKK